MDRIGFICEPDHPVFGGVAERLSARGFDVAFFSSGDPIPEADIEGLAALVNARIHPTAFAALSYADRSGIETWNGFLATTALSCRLIALHALEHVGCQVPEVYFEKPAGEFVSRNLYSWSGTPSLGEEGDFFQERITDEPIEQRYYAVNDGCETHLRAVRVRSELTGPERLTAQEDVDVTLAARVRELLDWFEARALGVTFVTGSSGQVAIDIDPAPSFSGTEMDRRIADSVASLTTIGA